MRICDDSVRIRTDTTLDQDCVLKATCVRMYIMHCHVIADNKSEFCHSSSHVDCIFNAGLVS